MSVMILVEVDGGIAWPEVILGKADIVEIDWDVAKEGDPDEIQSMIDDAKRLPDTYANKAKILAQLRKALKAAKEA